MVPVELKILPFTEYKVDLQPQQQAGRIQGTYEFSALNTGNATLPLRLEGRDEANAMNFRFRPMEITPLAGQQINVQVRARLKGWKWIGKPNTYPFSVIATPVGEDIAPQQAIGRLVHQPPIPPQVIALLLPLLLLALLAGAFLWQRNNAEKTAATNATATALAAALGGGANGAVAPGGANGAGGAAPEAVAGAAAGVGGAAGGVAPEATAGGAAAAGDGGGAGAAGGEAASETEPSPTAVSSGCRDYQLPGNRRRRRRASPACARHRRGESGGCDHQ